MIARRLLLLAFAILLGAAAPYTPVNSIPSVAAFKLRNFASLQTVTLSGFYADGDSGGGASYSLAGSDCGTDIPGYCLHDGAGNPFVRSNLTASLSPFGIVKGSALDYDSNVSSPNDAAPTIAAALGVLQPKGFNVAHLNGVSVYLGTTLTLGDYQGLNCDVTSTGPFDTGQYFGHPGTIVESYNSDATGTRLTASGNADQQVVENCILTTEWYENPAKVSAFSGYSFNKPGVAYPDLEAIRGNMIKAAQVGIYFNSVRNGRLEHLGLYGFDNAIHLKNPNESIVRDIRDDADISVYTEGGGSTDIFNNVHAQNYLTKQVDDVNGVNIPNNSNWDITSIGQGAVNSWGTHNCRLTVTNGVYPNGGAAPTSDIHTSALTSLGQPITYPAWAANFTKTSDGSANGLSCKGYGGWPVNKISDDGTSVVLDFVGSQLGTGADIITGTATWSTDPTKCMPQPCTIIYLTSGDVNSIQIGETVAATGIPTGTKVLGLLPGEKGDDPYDGYIAAYIVDHLATIAGSDTAVTFDGGSYTSQGGCGDAKLFACMFLDSTQRALAGNGVAGQFTSLFPLVNGVPVGSDFACNHTVGARLTNMQSFAHRISMAIDNCNGIEVAGQGSDDSNKGEDDYATYGVYLIGPTNKGLFEGGLSGSGSGMIEDTSVVTQTSAHGTTVSSGGGNGLVTLTVSSSMAAWAKDGSGHLTVALCLTLVNSVCTDGDPGTEYATADILTNTTIKLIDRGQLGTPILNVASSWNVIQGTVKPNNSSIVLTSAALGTTGDGANQFSLLHGSVAMTNVTAKDNNSIGYVSNNFITDSFTANLFPGMTLYYDGATGFATSTGCGNIWVYHYSWECLGSSPVASGTVMDLTAHDWTCDASAGQKTLILPAAAGEPNFFYTVTKIDSSPNLCIIDTTSPDMVGGASDVILGVFNDAISIKNANGTTWIVQ